MTPPRVRLPVECAKFTLADLCIRVHGASRLQPPSLVLTGVPLNLTSSTTCRRPSSNFATVILFLFGPAVNAVAAFKLGGTALAVCNLTTFEFTRPEFALHLRCARFRMGLSCQLSSQSALFNPWLSCRNQLFYIFLASLFMFALAVSFVVAHVSSSSRRFVLHNCPQSCCGHSAFTNFDLVALGRAEGVIAAFVSGRFDFRCFGSTGLILRGLFVLEPLSLC